MSKTNNDSQKDEGLFEGIDWEKELSDWDVSAAGNLPKASVADANISRETASTEAENTVARTSVLPSSRASSRPLYRPPVSKPPKTSVSSVPPSRTAHVSSLPPPKSVSTRPQFSLESLDFESDEHTVSEPVSEQLSTHVETEYQPVVQEQNQEAASNISNLLSIDPIKIQKTETQSPFSERNAGPDTYKDEAIPSIVHTKATVQRIAKSDDEPAYQAIQEDIQVWLNRAERTAQQARLFNTKKDQAQGLVVASELAAIAGHASQALRLAEEAFALMSTSTTVVRQLRQLLASEQRWAEILPLLDVEMKNQASNVAKNHAAILAASISRSLGLADVEVNHWYSVAHSFDTQDLHSILAQMKFALVRREPLPQLNWPESAQHLAQHFEERAQGEFKQDRALIDWHEALLSHSRNQNNSLNKVLSALHLLHTNPTLAQAAQCLQTAFNASKETNQAQAMRDAQSITDETLSAEAQLAIALDSQDIENALSASRSLFENTSDARAWMLVCALYALSKQSQSDSLNEWVDAASMLNVPSALAHASALVVGQKPKKSQPTELGIYHNVAYALTAQQDVDESLWAHTSSLVQRGFTLINALYSEDVRSILSALYDIVPLPLEQQNFASMLCALTEGNSSAALQAARDLLQQDPTHELALSTLFGLQDPDTYAFALTASQAAEKSEQAYVFSMYAACEALLRKEFELAQQRAEAMLAHKPADPIAFFLVEFCACRQHDDKSLNATLQSRIESSDDQTEKTRDIVRLALLNVRLDHSRSVALLSEAIQLQPDDATVRALYEQIAGNEAVGRTEWRANLARTLDGSVKAEILLDAAREAEAIADFSSAEANALQAEKEGWGVEATMLRRRVQSRGDRSTQLASELLEEANTAKDLYVQQEAYEKLAELDRITHKDSVSALRWYRASIELMPNHLPTLRRLEHILIGNGYEEEYESIASELARTVAVDARDAHAEVAAVLRLRRSDTQWNAIEDLIELVNEGDHSSLWAIRMLESLALFRKDDAMLVKATSRLLAYEQDPNSISILATRAAEASFRLSEYEATRSFLQQALSANPQHPAALSLVIELCLHVQDFRSAAEALETRAQSQQVAKHQLEDWHAAAVLWLDHVGDTTHGERALEQAAQRDLNYADVFTRCIALARNAKDVSKIESFYTQKLEHVEEAALRSQLYVEQASHCIELGELELARRSLAYALDCDSQNIDALRVSTQLDEQACDWSSLELHLKRLLTLASDPKEQILLLEKLASLYETDLRNPTNEKSILSQLLTFSPENDRLLLRFVALHTQLGEHEQAIQTQQERVRLATDFITKRDRLLGLAHIIDELTQNREQAIQVFEQAIALNTCDVQTLSAWVEFHHRHSTSEQAKQAINEAIRTTREQLTKDVCHVPTLDQLRRLLELDQQIDAAHAILAVLKTIQNEPLEWVGGADAASVPEIDAIVCPTELTQTFRQFLAKVGEALEKSVSIDLRALKAVKLGATNPEAKANIDAIARGFGLTEPDVVLSRAQPLACIPVGIRPFQLVVGEGVLNVENQNARNFSLVRMIKICGSHMASLVRIPEGEFKILLDALFHYLQPEYPAPELEAEPLDEMTKRFQRFIPRKEEAEIKALAATLLTEGVPAIDVLAKAASRWAERVALLAVGDLNAALVSMAWVLGEQKVPESPEARQGWIRSHEAAQELVQFATSEQYILARRHMGLQ